jgi:hypothetical protein
MIGTHYGVPKITEDTADPLHPRVHVQRERCKKLDGNWAEAHGYSAGPISPTDGISLPTHR